MIKLDYKNADAMVIGADNGLHIHSEFAKYQEKIKNIIVDLNERKDQSGQWLKWMNGKILCAQ